MMDTRIIRSARRSFALQVTPEGLIVRVPNRATNRQVQDFIAKYQDWINKATARQEQQRKAMGDVPPLTGEELHALAEKALAYIPERVKFYAPQIGVTYGRITIRN